MAVSALTFQPQYTDDVSTPNHSWIWWYTLTPWYLTEPDVEWSAPGWTGTVLVAAFTQNFSCLRTLIPWWGLPLYRQTRGVSPADMMSSLLAHWLMKTFAWSWNLLLDLRLLMRHCSIGLTQTNSNQTDEWHGYFPWSAGGFQGVAQEALPSAKGIYVHPSGIIYVQKLQRRVAFHTGFEGEGPNRLSVQLWWTFEADQPFACTETTCLLF